MPEDPSDLRYRVGLSIMMGVFAGCLVGGLAFSFVDRPWAWAIFAVTSVVAAVLFAPYIKN